MANQIVKRYRPRYLRGISGKFITAINILPVGKNRFYSSGLDPEAQDALAAYSDWKMIGEDLKAGISQYERELSIK